MRFSLALLVLLTSCIPSIRSDVFTTRETLKYDEQVLIIGTEDASPSNAQLIGTITIGDSADRTLCDWKSVLNTAQLEARKMGGNTVKIVDHFPPDWDSPCHRIRALIYFKAG